MLNDVDRNESSAVHIVASFLFLVLAAGSLFWFLFIANPQDGYVFKNRYERGQAIQVLAQQMSITNKVSGEPDFKKMPYLMRLYDEICFNSLLFKSPLHDHCAIMRRPVKESHGFSKFFALSLNQANFKPYVFYLCAINGFFFFALMQIWTSQKLYKQESSNMMLRFVELHIMSFVRVFHNPVENQEVIDSMNKALNGLDEDDDGMQDVEPQVQ